MRFSVFSKARFGCHGERSKKKIHELCQNIFLEYFYLVLEYSKLFIFIERILLSFIQNAAKERQEGEGCEGRKGGRP